MITESKMLVFVLRRADDCSNNGVTARFEQVMLYRNREAFEADDNPSKSLPALILCEKPSWRHEGRFHLYAVPVEVGHRHSMFGGNFVTSSDSRFWNEYPIPVHDRVE